MSRPDNLDRPIEEQASHLPSPQSSVSSDHVIRFLGDRVRAHNIYERSTLTGPAALNPGLENHLSFSSAQTPDQHRPIESSRSSLILVTPSTLESLGPESRSGLVAVDNPRREFARLVQHFFAEEVGGGVSPQAVIDPTAQIGVNSRVDPGAYIGPDVVVGIGCRIGANVTLLPGTVIGNHTSIGPNTTVGHVGFGYAREDDGSPVLIPHSGGVSIGSHVDIGANTCVDRGTLDDTVIEDHVKIDNLVHIAHNCRVEEGAFIIATAVLCGGVRVGPRTWIAPNASVREQLRVGADAVVGLGSTVIRDVPDGATVVGSPARQVES